MRGRKPVQLLELLTRKEVALEWDGKGDLLVCLVPDVQLLQAGVYTRGRYRR